MGFDMKSMLGPSCKQSSLCKHIISLSEMLHVSGVQSDGPLMGLLLWKSASIVVVFQSFIPCCCSKTAQSVAAQEPLFPAHGPLHLQIRIRTLTSRLYMSCSSSGHSITCTSSTPVLEQALDMLQFAMELQKLSVHNPICSGELLALLHMHMQPQSRPPCMMLAYSRHEATLCTASWQAYCCWSRHDASQSMCTAIICSISSKASQAACMQAG